MSLFKQYSADMKNINSMPGEKLSVIEFSLNVDTLNHIMTRPAHNSGLQSNDPVKDFNLNILGGNK
ncbi:MAG: hypothetical protein ACREF7_00975, partial [Candidatus Saccharimonadales bacterium]